MKLGSYCLHRCTILRTSIIEAVRHKIFWHSHISFRSSRVCIEEQHSRLDEPLDHVAASDHAIAAPVLLADVVVPERISPMQDKSWIGCVIELLQELSAP